MASGMRREEYAEATRRALLDAATQVFAEVGFSAGSLDEIARRARVTKGAIYHHFANKSALFEAVVRELEGRAMMRFDQLVSGESAPRDRMLACLRAVLEATGDPIYERLVLSDGAALGLVELEDGLRGRLAHELEQLQRASLIDPVPVPLLTEILWGAAAAAGAAVARSDDPMTARRTAGATLLRLVSGLWSDGETKRS